MLNLYDCNLRGYLNHLFAGQIGPGFPSLESFEWGPKFAQEDVECLGKALTRGMLSQLKELDLENNDLTGDLKLLFEGPNHPGFPEMEFLRLCNTDLCQEDVESLGDAIKAKKWPKLKELDLSENTLTGCLKSLFTGPDHPGFPCLEVLYLFGTRLDEEDVQSLSSALETGMFPELKELNLHGYMFCETVGPEMQALKDACRQRGSRLSISETSLAQEFVQELDNEVVHGLDEDFLQELGDEFVQQSEDEFVEDFYDEFEFM